MELLIRTSGESRLSDYLIWQSGQALIHFTPVLWPEFTFWELLVALVAYQRAAPSLEAAKAAAQHRAEECQRGPRDECLCCACTAPTLEQSPEPTADTVTCQQESREPTPGTETPQLLPPQHSTSNLTPQQQLREQSTGTAAPQQQSRGRSAGTTAPQQQSRELPARLDVQRTVDGVVTSSSAAAAPARVFDGQSTKPSSERWGTAGTLETGGEEVGRSEAPARAGRSSGGSAAKGNPSEHGSTAANGPSCRRGEIDHGNTQDVAREVEGGTEGEQDVSSARDIGGGTEGARDVGAGINLVVGDVQGAKEGGARAAARAAPKRRRGTRGTQGTTPDTTDGAGSPDLAWAAPPRALGHEEDPVPGCACCVVQQLRFHAACSDPVPGLKALMERKRARDAAARAAAAG